MQQFLRSKLISKVDDIKRNHQLFCKTPLLVTKIRNACLVLISKLENNGNPDFFKNGESTFVDNLFEYFSKINPDLCVLFDIGANRGHYSKMLSDKALQKKINYAIHLFEPTKACFEELCNELSQDNIIKNNFGISDCTTDTLIYFDKEKSEFASLYQRDLSRIGIDFQKSEQVQLRRLDEYIENQKINHIHFLKIDIEGHELNAFKGLGQYLNGTFIDFIQFEYGGANLDSRTCLKDFYNLFASAGFKIAKIKPNGIELREYVPFMDNCGHRSENVSFRPV